jgi:hypothetical protein
VQFNRKYRENERCQHLTDVTGRSGNKGWCFVDGRDGQDITPTPPPQTTPTTPPTPRVKKCGSRNFHANCPMWASLGDCQSSDPKVYTWMELNCGPVCCNTPQQLVISNDCTPNCDFCGSDGKCEQCAENKQMYAGKCFTAVNADNDVVTNNEYLVIEFTLKDSLSDGDVISGVIQNDSESIPFKMSLSTDNNGNMLNYNFGDYATAVGLVNAGASVSFSLLNDVISVTIDGSKLPGMPLADLSGHSWKGYSLKDVDSSGVESYMTIGIQV